MGHPFFRNINFDELLKKKVIPPYIPQNEKNHNKTFSFKLTPKYSEGFFLENFTYDEDNYSLYPKEKKSFC